jgi:two-component system, chemotaxis family, protein-glutamate methylesterase/glutaminase
MSILEANPTQTRVRVMVVDDSALMRKLLTQVLSRDPYIQVVDTAMDGQFALDHLVKIKPDVILMDIDMPRLDGLSALDRIVADYSIPVVMCSSRTTEGAAATLDALARGAVDFIEKPSVAALLSGEAAADITSRVRGAMGARVRVSRLRSSVINRRKEETGTVATAPISSTIPRATLEQIERLARQTMPEIVAIGTSTGGPPALEQVISQIPAKFPYGIVIVQHMPAGFTTLLASHLDRTSQVTVREATDGEPLHAGLALIAPGGKHMRVVRSSSGYTISLDEKGIPVNGHRPSADVLFESVANATRGKAVGVLMTGMGCDGAEGFGQLVKAGAMTIAQTPDSCICQGMPKSSIDRGYANAVVSLEDIASALIACSNFT